MQLTLTGLEVYRSCEVKGLLLGVCGDGTPFVSQRSLADMCGIEHRSVQYQSETWAAGNRTGKLAQMLVEDGFDRPELFIVVHQGKGRQYVYDDQVCTTFLRYYAEQGKPEAIKTLTLLARHGLRDFIYKAVGYDPSEDRDDRWRPFKDRMLLNSTPSGYWSVFRETADLEVASIKGGLPVDAHTMPDISVGNTWGRHWTDNRLDDVHGCRIRYEHHFPAYFPQPGVVEAWIYPDKALPAFRGWFRDVYLPTYFPAYIMGKANRGVIEEIRARSLIAVVVPAALEDKRGK